MKGKECERNNPWMKLNHIQTISCRNGKKMKGEVLGDKSTLWWVTLY